MNKSIKQKEGYTKDGVVVANEDIAEDPERSHIGWESDAHEAGHADTFHLLEVLDLIIREAENVTLRV